MFNLISPVKHAKEYIPYDKTVTVHEHKAPSIESAKYLDELREEARKNVIAQIPVENNLLKGCMIVMKDGYIDNSIKISLKFELNGEIITLEKSRDNSHIASTRQIYNGFIEETFEQFKTDLAEVIIKKAVMNAERIKA